MRRPSGEYTGRVGSRSGGVSATASPPARGSDHRTFWTSATSRSPDGEREAAPLVAAVKDRAAPLAPASCAQAVGAVTPARPAAAAAEAVPWRNLRRDSGVG